MSSCSLLGFIAKIPTAWTIGIIVLVIGLVLFTLARNGQGRRWPPCITGDRARAGLASDGAPGPLHAVRQADLAAVHAAVT